MHHAVEKAVPLLSTSGIVEIAEHVPWMMYQATPDACSVNMRREERVLEQLPNNVLGLKPVALHTKDTASSALVSLASLAMSTQSGCLAAMCIMAQNCRRLFGRH